MQAALLPDARLVEAEVLRVFPTFVWNAQLKPEIYRDLNAEILRKLDALRPRDQAAGIGWQSGYGLHTLDEFRPLIACICWVVEQVLEFLRHAHPNNFLSGVYYVQVQEGVDT